MDEYPELTPSAAADPLNPEEGQVFDIEERGYIHRVTVLAVTDIVVAVRYHKRGVDNPLDVGALTRAEFLTAAEIAEPRSDEIEQWAVCWYENGQWATVIHREVDQVLGFSIVRRDGVKWLVKLKPDMETLERVDLRAEDEPAEEVA